MNSTKGARVHGVGPGTVLGGRYTARERFGTATSGAERWSASDTTLGREVTLLVLPWDDAAADAVLDAARRAAGVDNRRLVRVLDVGTSNGVAFVVEEGLVGARTLTSRIIGGGLPSEEVRRVTGEAATGLEAARQRGLHHLHLGPDAVYCLPDGSVKVLGVATDSALAGDDDDESDADASRRDAVSIVTLVYAGLTGR